MASVGGKAAILNVHGTGFIRGEGVKSGRCPPEFSTTYDFKSARTPLLVMSKLPNFVLGRYGIVLDVRYLFLGII